MKQNSFTLFISVFSFFLGTTLLFSADTPAPVKIMPLGDSISYVNRVRDLDDPRPTGTRTAYRSHLWYSLEAAGFSADFVGSRIAGQSVTPPFDADNEGHPGWTSYDIAENAYSYMANSAPDMVLLHIGTNDHGEDVSGVASILNEIDIYEQSSGRSVRVLLALIIDRKSPDKLIRLFNENLQDLYLSRILDGDNITLVDMYNGAGMRSSDYADNTHPNDSGFSKMAGVWNNAILAPYNYNQALFTFPSTVVDKSYIESVNFDHTSNTIQFIAEVPDSGITF